MGKQNEKIMLFAARASPDWPVEPSVAIDRSTINGVDNDIVAAANAYGLVMLGSNAKYKDVLYYHEIAHTYLDPSYTGKVNNIRTEYKCDMFAAMKVGKARTLKALRWLQGTVKEKKYKRIVQKRIDHLERNYMPSTKKQCTRIHNTEQEHKELVYYTSTAEGTCQGVQSNNNSIALLVFVLWIAIGIAVGIFSKVLFKSSLLALFLAFIVLEVVPANKEALRSLFRR